MLRRDRGEKHRQGYDRKEPSTLLVHALALPPSGAASALSAVSFFPHEFRSPLSESLSHYSQVSGIALWFAIILFYVQDNPPPAGRRTARAPVSA